MFRAQQNGLKGPPLWLVPKGRVCFIVRTPIPIKKKKKKKRRERVEQWHGKLKTNQSGHICNSPQFEGNEKDMQNPWLFYLQ